MKKSGFLFKSATGIVVLLVLFAFKTSTNNDIKKIDFYADPSMKGKVMVLVKEELAAGRKPVLFFTATWCGPCRQFKNSLSNILMIDALKGSTLILIDGDIDAKSDKIAAKYDVSAYPTFVRVNEQGELIKKTDGGAWEENIPENMAPVMKKFMKD
ncbi:MAG TPA: thioredoxin domain-containing protein [Bacteroidia bacterium]